MTPIEMVYICAVFVSGIVGIAVVANIIVNLMGEYDAD